MDEQNNHPHDPWNQDSYETGSTKPPKSRGGLIALLLIGNYVWKMSLMRAEKRLIEEGKKVSA